jgi:hypothetical protein
MAARERGEIKEVLPTRAALELPAAEIYERPKGWRKFFFGIRKRPTANTAMRRIAEME